MISEKGLRTTEFRFSYCPVTFRLFDRTPVRRLSRLKWRDLAQPASAISRATQLGCQRKFRFVICICFLIGFLRGQPINLDTQSALQTISRNQYTPGYLSALQYANNGVFATPVREWQEQTGWGDRPDPVEWPREWEGLLLFHVGEEGAGDFAFFSEEGGVEFRRTRFEGNVKLHVGSTLGNVGGKLVSLDLDVGSFR